MAKTGYINVRVENNLKGKAERVLRRVGVNTSNAVTMFLRQVVIRQGIPFEVRAPNKESLKAIRELRDPKRRGKSYATTDEMFKDILGKNWRDRT